MLKWGRSIFGLFQDMVERNVYQLIGKGRAMEMIMTAGMVTMKMPTELDKPCGTTSGTSRLLQWHCRYMKTLLGDQQSN
jgi:hypothetical protein